MKGGREGDPGERQEDPDPPVSGALGTEPPAEPEGGVRASQGTGSTSKKVAAPGASQILG